MTQKNQRIEPTFGTPNKEPTQETFMPVADETVATEAEKVAENVTAELDNAQNALKSPLVSMSTQQAPNHTFEMPMRHPDDMDKQKIYYNENHNVAAENIVKDPLPVSGVVTPALQVHSAQLASQQAQAQAAMQAVQNSQETVKNDAAVAGATFARAAAAGVAATAAAASMAQPKEAEKAASNNSFERVIPTTSANVTHEGKTDKMPKVPSKYRRLLLVLLLALVLFLVWFLLKPSAGSNQVESAEQTQSNNLPIEFRPVDEAEAKAAEAREAAALAQQQTEAQQAQEQAQQVQQAAEAASTPAQNEPAAEQQSAAAEAAKAVVAAAPAVVKVDRPKTQASVIHQNEPQRAERTERRQEPAMRTVERLKPAAKAETPKATAAKASETAKQTTAPASKEVAKAKTVERAPVTTAAAKSTTQSASKANTETAVKPAAQAEKAAAPASGSAKTMTVPKGVSLMQVFRDNGLGGNLPDVNAMNKTNSAVSNLKAGDKVTVKMSGGKVAEMSISSGGKFIRQADGSYRYSK